MEEEACAEEEEEDGEGGERDVTFLGEGDYLPGGECGREGGGECGEYGSINVRRVSRLEPRVEAWYKRCWCKRRGTRRQVLIKRQDANDGSRRNNEEIAWNAYRVQEYRYGLVEQHCTALYSSLTHLSAMGPIYGSQNLSSPSWASFQALKAA